MERIPYTPPPLPNAAMPPEIGAAVFGTTASENSEPMPSAPANPWLPKEGEGRLPFVSEEMEEMELRDALSPIEKLFHPDALTASPKEAARFRFTKRPTYTTPPSETTEKWDDEIGGNGLEKNAGGLRYERHVGEDGTAWRRGVDAAGNLVSMLMILDDDGT